MKVKEYRELGLCSCTTILVQVSVYLTTVLRSVAYSQIILCTLRILFIPKPFKNARAILYGFAHKTTCVFVRKVRMKRAQNRTIRILCTLYSHLCKSVFIKNPVSLWLKTALCDVPRKTKGYYEWRLWRSNKKNFFTFYWYHFPWVLERNLYNLIVCSTIVYFR